MLASQPEAVRQAVLADLSPAELTALEYDWKFWGRPNQQPPPGEWRTWLLLAGRGFGKTRTGAEWTRSAKDRFARLALIAPTAADVRDVIVEGESGLLATAPPWDRPVYEPSKRRVTWQNGAQAACYSADEPERLRGPQHHAGWCDEVASWRYPETWDMFMFGLRLGSDPRVVVTTTPKPVKLIRELLKSPTTEVTRGSTYDNRANLAAPFFEQIVSKYEGTRLGRQELNAELLDDIEGAMWTRGMLDACRVTQSQVPALRRIVIAVDPSGCSGLDDFRSDEIGLIAAGEDGKGTAIVLEDRSGRYSPDGWGAEAVKMMDFWQADRIIGERNFGGAMVESTIRATRPNAPVKLVTASRGKTQRAEPVAALYEQSRVKHMGAFPEMEDQLCAFSAAGYQGPKSPDRADAMVWAVTELLLEERKTFAFGSV